MYQTPSRSTLKSVLSTLKQYLEEQYPDRMSRLILFGSYARQEATENSDVDILIVLKDPFDASTEIDRTSEFVAQLCLDNNLLISRLFMPESRYETENSPLLRNIRKEGIEL
ncbi:MAG: nucleotidyltransferase domain-containing protein [Cyanobacteria bacterium J06636_16]